jgi:hypothetical protein
MQSAVLFAREERALSRALTLQYDEVQFILEPSEQAKAAIGKRVTVVDFLMAGWPSATAASNSLTALSTSFVRSTRGRLPRTSSWARCWR